MSNLLALRDQIVAFAKATGFDAVGIARADAPLTEEYARYESFLAQGFHGEMEFLERHREERRRIDHPRMLRGAKTVLCFASSYKRTDEAQDPPFAQTIARYARGRDYHNFVRTRLRKVSNYLRGMKDPEGQPVRTRTLLDQEPILERAWAARSGLGFVGKNGLIIVPGLGSMLLLGEVITTLDLPVGNPVAERCGSCTRCLDACPTEAFPEPWVLNASKCISYQTIERKTAPTEEESRLFGDHLFGCDDCQTVCPFNGYKETRANETHPFLPLERWQTTTLETAAELPEAEWDVFSIGSPLRRAGLEKVRRNALRVLENRRVPRSR